LLRRLAATAVGIILLALLAVPAAQAQTGFQTITSAGPLNSIAVGADLGCQVGDVEDSSFEFYPGAVAPGDCGTFLTVNASAAAGATAEIFGPNFAEHSMSATHFAGLTNYVPFTVLSQAAVTGSGTPVSPYLITTNDTATDGLYKLTIAETDAYVVGSDFYVTSVRVTNSSKLAFSGKIYHAADCFLRGSDSGYGWIDTSGPDGTTAACTTNANNSPPSALEEMLPLGTTSSANQTLGPAHYTEEHWGGASGQIWGDIARAVDFRNGCDCKIGEDNAEGINWDITNLPAGASDQFTLETKIDDPGITATGVQALTGTAGAQLNATLATITDSDKNTASSNYDATINWGDGSSDQNATITGANGSFQVSDSHTYAAAGSYPISVLISYANNPKNSTGVIDSATISVSQPPPVNGGPAVTPSAPVVTGTTSAQVAAAVTPNGLPTTAYFQYQLTSSSAGPGGPPPTVLTTPAQQVGSDFTSHQLTASLTGLVPNAQYEERIVASNSAGTVYGPEQTFETTIDGSAMTATGGMSLTGSAGNTVSGTLATITDSVTNTRSGDYTATVNWGDGTPPDQNATIAGGNGTFQVGDSHTYAASGHYTITVGVSYDGIPSKTAVATDSAAISAPQIMGAPAVTPSPSVVTGTTSAQVAGVVTPNGLPTTAHFQYQLTAASPSGTPSTVLTTPAQQVGSDFKSHLVTASLTGLVPSAQYKVSLVATNSSGTVSGMPAQTFTTKKDRPPPPPILGKAVNVSVVSGKVWIKLPPGFGGASDNVSASAALSKGQGFVPLTEARQIPTGSEIDTQHGTLKLVTAGLSVGKSQTATLTGGVYQTTQITKGISKGLTNLNLVYGAFQGGPTLQKCMAPKKKPKAADAQIARLNLSILQTLRASAHGRFRTSGRYAAATIRGTIWSISDLCSGTRVRAIRDTVIVQDFVRRKTILLRPGHTYLALAFQKKRK
jgi:hypothetical protein